MLLLDMSLPQHACKLHKPIVWELSHLPLDTGQKKSLCLRKAFDVSVQYLEAATLPFSLKQARISSEMDSAISATSSSTS